MSILLGNEAYKEVNIYLSGTCIKQLELYITKWCNN